MKCSHTKSDGTSCTANAMHNSKYCCFHDPDIPDEEKNLIRIEAAKKSKQSEFIGSPMPEMKFEKIVDVVSLLTTTINKVLTGKISHKSGSSIGYLSFVLLMAMDKADAQNERERIAKLKAEGKYIPESQYIPKTYTYKDEFYLDKDGKALIVEHNKINFGKKFRPEDKKRHRRKVKIKYPLTNEESEKDINGQSEQFLKILDDMKKVEEINTS